MIRLAASHLIAPANATRSLWLLDGAKVGLGSSAADSSGTVWDRTDKVVGRGCSSRAAQARNSNVYLRGVSGVSLSLAGRVGSGRAATLCSRANPPAESTTNRQPRLTANQRARSAP